jgi:predicted amidohydrolase YtcJ
MRMRNIVIGISLLLLTCFFPQAGHAENGPPPSVILHNAKIYTMEDHPRTADAIFIVGDKIAAIGDSKTILNIRKPNTTVIDLNGKIVFPGFIDPHTHLFNGYMPYFQFSSLDHAQKLAIENGVTSFANMHADQRWFDFFMQYAQAGYMRNRLFLYLSYNGACGLPPFGTWYENYTPRVEHAPFVWVNGVKIFAEKSVCQGNSTRPVFSDELKANLGADSLYRNTQLLLSQEELTSVIKRANASGYQVAIHAMGDLGVETSLSAIKSALDGGANTNRHMVLHNSFLRDDMFQMYSDSNIVALIEPDSSCEVSTYIKRYGETNVNHYYKRWRELMNTGIHIAIDSDWNNYGDQILNPMSKIYTMVTGNNQFTVYSCPTPLIPITEGRLTVWEVLKMMTIEAAYALRMEKKLGSIKSGKYADLVVLSDDPLSVDPNDIINIKVLMTMIGGRIEYDVR